MEQYAQRNDDGARAHASLCAYVRRLQKYQLLKMRRAWRTHASVRRTVAYPSGVHRTAQHFNANGHGVYGTCVTRVHYIIHNTNETLTFYAYTDECNLK